jgi:hypothetical protein
MMGRSGGRPGANLLWPINNGTRRETVRLYVGKGL